MAKFKEYILEQYDDNCDGKISMTEVGKDIINRQTSVRYLLLFNSYNICPIYKF